MNDERTGLPIKRKRLERAVAMIERYCMMLDEDEVQDVATEIGLFDCLSWGLNRQVDFDFTDLQAVSFAYALFAIAEQKGLTGIAQETEEIKPDDTLRRRKKDANSKDRPRLR